jgi:hypothetical protein
MQATGRFVSAGLSSMSLSSGAEWRPRGKGGAQDTAPAHSVSQFYWGGRRKDHLPASSLMAWGAPFAAS